MPRPCNCSATIRSRAIAQSDIPCFCLVAVGLPAYPLSAFSFFSLAPEISPFGRA